MRIAICSDLYYPMANGVAVFAHNLAIGLKKRGHEVLVVSPSFNGRKHRYTDPETGVTTMSLTSKRFAFFPDQINKVPEKKEFLGHPMPRLVYKNGIWWSTHPWKELKKALDEFQPDVIHLQTAESIALATMTYVRRNNIPLVTTGHAYPDNITSQFKWLKPIKKPVDATIRKYMASFLKHAEYATMPTEIAIDDLVPKNRKNFKVTVEPLSNGVDLSSFKPGKPSKVVCEKYNIDLNIPRVLYIGRVDREKSIGVVVRAFSLVLEKMKDAKVLPELLVVGDGIDKENLEKLAVELGITDHARFLGRITPPTLNELYKTGTLFATASETETQGIVLIEAAATGLPLVAVNAGAVPELCQNNVNGILCEPKDVEGMADAMMKILSNPKLAAKYGEESLKISKNHDVNRTLKRFEEIYEEAIRLKKEKTA